MYSPRVRLIIPFFAIFLIQVSLPIAAAEWVNINGSVDYDGTPVVAVVLANGQREFTNNPVGEFNLDVPLNTDGEITLYAFCSGLAPFKTTLTPAEAVDFDVDLVPPSSDSKEMTVTIHTEEGAENPDWIRIWGTVTYKGQYLCAMVLANGQNMFTCGNDLGTFDLEVPLDGNGKITLYVFCSGFAPYKAVSPPATTGYKSLFIGHSFFKPFADNIDDHAQAAGYTDHSQDVVYAGGANGSPEALWNHVTRRERIQAILDEGDLELFGMTYAGDYPTLTGYKNWVDYALIDNPDVQFFIGISWGRNPGSYETSEMDARWEDFETDTLHPMIDALRADYPNNTFYCIPYGRAALELILLYESGDLSDVSSFIGEFETSLFVDTTGHPGKILVELGVLVWLEAIYGVDLNLYEYDSDFATDLRAIASEIMATHDPVYNAF